jgi:hypothetical protein
LKDNIAAIIGACVAAAVVVGFLVFLSSRRRRGHSFKRDAWGFDTCVLLAVGLLIDIYQIVRTHFCKRFCNFMLE